MEAKAISTKLTQEQLDILAAQFPDTPTADVIRMALTALAERHGYDWLEVELQHGGVRPGSGRKPGTPNKRGKRKLVVDNHRKL